MSQPPMNEPPFAPPPTFDSPFEPRTLAEKTEYVNKYVNFALILSISSLACCGFIGFYSFGLAASVIETIDYYNVAREKRGLAMAAKIISLIGAVAWVVGLVGRFLFRWW